MMDAKRAALAAHKSQQDWLDASQGMSSFLSAMEQMSMDLGRMSGCFEHAEGWRRRLHYGFSNAEYDPIAEDLRGKLVNNPDYHTDTKT